MRLLFTLHDPDQIGYPQILLVLLTVLIVLTVLVALSTSGAAFDVYNTGWEGASNLRGEASAVGAESRVAQNTTLYEEVTANETIAVILSPERRYDPAAANRIQRFVERGGTVLVADDFGPHSNQLLARIGVRSRFDGDLLRDEVFNRGSPGLVVVNQLSPHPITANVDELTLNYGTAIVPTGNQTRVVARTSAVAYLDRNRNATIDPNETLAAYPVVGVETQGSGAVILLGDPSVVINEMLDQPDNRAFVRTLFRQHSLVLLDYSHHGGVPLLALAVFLIRNTPVLQTIIGGVGIILVGLWYRWPSISHRLPIVKRVVTRDAPPSPTAGISELGLKQIMQRRYPDWDPERIDRVVDGILTMRAEDSDNE